MDFDDSGTKETTNCLDIWKGGLYVNNQIVTLFQLGEDSIFDPVLELSAKSESLDYDVYERRI